MPGRSTIDSRASPCGRCLRGSNPTRPRGYLRRLMSRRRPPTSVHDSPFKPTSSPRSDRRAHSHAPGIPCARCPPLKFTWGSVRTRSTSRPGSLARLGSLLPEAVLKADMRHCVSSARIYRHTSRGGAIAETRRLPRYHVDRRDGELAKPRRTFRAAREAGRARFERRDRWWLLSGAPWEMRPALPPPRICAVCPLCRCHHACGAR